MPPSPPLSLHPVATGAMPAKPLAAPDPKSLQMRRLKKATADFESLFLSQLLAAMQRTVGHQNVAGNYGGETMMNVAQEKLAESLSQQGGLGLGEMPYKSLEGRVANDSATPTATRPPPDATPIPLPKNDAAPRPLAPTGSMHPLSS